MLTKAVEYVVSAQTTRGGWGYVSAKEGNDFDEGSVTITQIQALRAARNAGIPVPREAVVKTVEVIGLDAESSQQSASEFRFGVHRAVLSVM